MKTEIRDKFIMLVPAFWAAVFDIIITIVYQPKEYWNGNLDIANEANPIGAFAMKYHILGIFVISILWLILIAIIGSCLSKKWLMPFSLFVVMCHTWGGSSWIMNHFGFWFVMLYIIFNSFLFIYVQGIYNSKILVRALNN